MTTKRPEGRIAVVVVSLELLLCLLLFVAEEVYNKSNNCNDFDPGAAHMSAIILFDVKVSSFVSSPFFVVESAEAVHSNNGGIAL